MFSYISYNLFSFRKSIQDYTVHIDMEIVIFVGINLLMPNDDYSGRTAPLTSKRCILYIYSTHIGTEYLNMVYTLRFFFFKMQFVS